MKRIILRFVESFIRPPTVGIDISDLSIKYFQFRSNGSIRCPLFGEVTLQEGTIVNGEIQQEDIVVKALQTLRLNEKQWRSSFLVVASLPEEKSFLRLIQMPKVKREEVDRAIRWEIEANIPLSPEEVLYGHEILEPLENHLDHFDVVITAFSKGIVESYVRVLNQAGFRVGALELESQAIVRASLPDLREKAARIVVDLGRNRTGFIIFAGGGILFTKTVEFGGKTFEDNIAKTLGVSQEEAGRIKKEVGLDRKAYEGKVFSALVPAVAALADELQRAVEYYQDHTGHTHGAMATISEVLLVGGDGNLIGLPTYLSSALRVPVRVADPFVSVWGRLNPPIPPLPHNKSIAFATSIGLALRGIR